ncbi:MAG: hypothetical protein E7668_02755 [Ruminococcaceae bacterium]|nr:hypothetical protein [Oscillospiraceae bacterium]
MKQKVNYALMSVLGFLVLIAPMLTVVILNWEEYTAHSYGGTIKLTAGGVMAAVFLFLMVLGKLKMPRGIIIAGVIFGFAWLLESILQDLKLLSGMFLLGETLYYIFFQTILKRMRDQLKEGAPKNE